MGAVGRPRLSEEVKEIKGTARNDRKQAAVSGLRPVGLLAEIPNPPDSFDDKPRAQYQWRFACEEMFNLGMLRPIMLDWIAIYCLSIDDYFYFREKAESSNWLVQFQDHEGNVTGEGVSKYIDLSDRALIKAQQTLKLLCLDPETVRKLSPQATEKPKSKLDQLKARRNG